MKKALQVWRICTVMTGLRRKFGHVSLVLWLLTSITHAQSLTVLPDSVNTDKTTLAKPQVQKNSQPKILDPQRIAVRAGDSISYSVQVFDHTGRNTGLWRNLAKAVVPAVVVGSVTSQQSAPVGEQKASSLPAFGVGAAVIPGAVALLQQHAKLKTFIGLVVRDSAGRQVATVSSRMTRAARKDWEQLTATYVAKEDGFVEVITHIQNPEQVALNEGQLALKGRSITSDKPKSTDTKDTQAPLGGGMQTNDIKNCISYYWVMFENGIAVNATFLYMDCGEDLYWGNPSPEFSYHAEYCACKREAGSKLADDNRSYTTAIELANAKKFGACVSYGEKLIVACGLGAAGAFIKVEAGSSVFLVIPLIGEVVEIGAQVVAVLGALAAFGGCGTALYFSDLAPAFAEYNNMIANADRDWHEAQRSYHEKMDTCGNCSCR